MSAEALRQRALVEALLAPRSDSALPPGLAEQGERARAGLSAYRSNAGAVAERALAAVFPTLAALLGDADFAHLAREHWRAVPPERGDLGQWGAALPDWLDAHAGLAAWPYLADCARLDLALHRCEQADDAALDAASLARLGSEDPSMLVLQLLPGSALLRSSWPIAAIHAAHRPDAAAAAFDDARAAIAARQGQAVLVARSGWRGAVHLIDAADAAFVAALLDGVPLADALDRAGTTFDFAGWFARALRNAWLQGVRRRGD
ncbi:MAG: putative DNA-binding domain-containing protein [Proteobacteria bacterium]|nr:putative DNA-binding domain-containing protein [Pseudomonadota bacterium]